eukprot:2075626-Prymnesium_polylepis.1
MPAARSAGSWSMTASKTGRSAEGGHTGHVAQRVGIGLAALRVDGGDGGGGVRVAEVHDRALV